MESEEKGNLSFFMSYHETSIYHWGSDPSLFLIQAQQKEDIQRNENREKTGNEKAATNFDAEVNVAAGLQEPEPPKMTNDTSWLEPDSTQQGILSVLTSDSDSHDEVNTFI